MFTYYKLYNSGSTTTRVCAADKLWNTLLLEKYLRIASKRGDKTHSAAYTGGGTGHGIFGYSRKLWLGTVVWSLYNWSPHLVSGPQLSAIIKYICPGRMWIYNMNDDRENTEETRLGRGQWSFFNIGTRRWAQHAKQDFLCSSIYACYIYSIRSYLTGLITWLWINLLCQLSK